MFMNFVPFRPRRPDGVLWLALLGRVSTEHQRKENITASQNACEKLMKPLHDGDIKFLRFGDQGSGWLAHRTAIDEVYRLIEEELIDGVIAEDLARPFRNPRFQFEFAQRCKDHNVRLICPGDALDTADPNWEVVLHAAVIRHGMVVPETRRRVRRTADHNFDNGGMVLKFPFGYRRVSPEEAARGDGERIARLPECTPVFREIAFRILRGDSYESIAEWLNNAEIPTGEYASSKVWTGKLVRDLMRNVLLSGVRTFRAFEFEIVYQTGEHNRKKNPNPSTRFVPSLAHFSPAEHREIIYAMDERKEACKPKTEHGRKNRPRRMTLWPGQHLRCTICGDELFWYGKVLRCRNASPGRPRSCWNQTVVKAAQIRSKLLPEIVGTLKTRPLAYEAFLSSAWNEFELTFNKSLRRQKSLKEEIRSLEKDLKTLGDLLVRKSSDDLLNRFCAAEELIEAKKEELSAFEAAGDAQQLYRTREEFEADLDRALLRLAGSSFGFQQLLKRLFPDFAFIPVQAFDSGQVHPRVRLTIPSDAETTASHVIEIDAFDSPNHVRLANRVAELKTDHPEWSFQAIADFLKEGRQSVFQAYKTATRMREAGLTEPYEVLTDAPAYASRWRKDSLRDGKLGKIAPRTSENSTELRPSVEPPELHLPPFGGDGSESAA
jgi:site-specific DNA recombinase